jgi:cold shock protein
MEGFHMATQLDRIEQMLRALCAHLGVQDWEKSSTGAQDSIGPDSGQRYTGSVSRFEHGWGFIECEALNRNFFVHYSDIEGTGLRSLDAGDVVSFEIAPGKDGRPKAIRVRRQAAGQPVVRIPRPQPARRAGYGYPERGIESIESDEDLSDAPAPARTPGPALAGAAATGATGDGSSDTDE